MPKRARESEEPQPAINGAELKVMRSENTGSKDTNGSRDVNTYEEGPRASASASASPAPIAVAAIIPSPAPKPSATASARQTQVDNPAKLNRDRAITQETLEQSFFLLEPHDEFTREVGDWIWTWISNRANVEVRRFYWI